MCDLEHFSKIRSQMLLPPYNSYQVRTAQNFDGENIDEFDEFPAIRQYFSNQNFSFS